MKKILYVAFLDIKGEHFGVNKKIINQCKELEAKGNKCEILARHKNEIICIDTNGNTIKTTENKIKKMDNRFLKNLYYKQYQYKELEELVNTFKYDVIYIRYDLSGRNFIRTLKTIKNKDNKILIEVPTYPYAKEYSTSIFHKFKLLIDSLYNKKLVKYVSKVVTYYDTEFIFNIPTIKTFNGFNFNEVYLNENQQIDHCKINIIAVSSMRLWHGYERAIEGLNVYYNENREKNKKLIILHLVGEGPEYNKYKEMTKKYNLEKFVKFYGNLTGEKLDQVFNKCDLAIDSLARHRTNISVLSSLKSREYGAKGIPIINSCKIDVLEKDYKYVLYVNENEEPINMEDIINYYNNIYNNSDKKNIMLEIRNYFEEHTSMEKSVRGINEFVNS